MNSNDWALRTTTAKTVRPAILRQAQDHAGVWVLTLYH